MSDLSMDVDKSGLELAKSAFILVKPNAGASEQLWDAYSAERLAVQESFNTVLLSGEEEIEFEEMGDRAIATAISDAVHKLEEELSLPHDSLLSGTSILYEDSSFEEEDQPRTVRLLTRIYSVYSPSSIDLHLTYHSRSRMESIEWFIGIGYKINTRLSPNKLPKSSELFRQIGLSNGSEFSFSMYNGYGWNTFYKAAFDDEMGFSGRRWKRYEVKEVGLYEDGLRDVHDALLGPHPCMENELPQNPETENTKRKRLIQTARLLLACVGISCSIGTQDSETDQMPGWRSLDWNLEGIPRWFAREVRKGAGFQLDRDAEEARKHAQSVKEEMQGFYSDDDEAGSSDVFDDD